jgi:hypothetical protein
MRVFKLSLLVLTVSTAVHPGPARSDGADRKSAADEIARALDGQGVDKAVDRFERIRADTTGYEFDESAFNALGYRLIRSGRIDAAVAVMTMMTTLFPGSWNAWDSRGEAHRYAADRKQAVAAYEKSLALNPENENAEWALTKMDGRIEDMRRETREPPAYVPGENTGLEGPYLGQELPGETPVVFAPGIVSVRGNFEFAITFTADGRELYFSSHTGMHVSRWEEDGWTAPDTAPCAKVHPGAFEAHITPDGKRMYFGKGPEIWVMDRTGDGWGEARRHGPGMFVTTTADGVIYVTDISTHTMGQVVVQRPVEGGYAPAEPAGGGVSDSTGAAHPCVAHDERFVVFDSWRNGTIGQSDLFVCARTADGSWGEAIHLPEGINTEGENIAATLSPDGSFLFFTTNNDIYWVSASLLDNLIARSQR